MALKKTLLAGAEVVPCPLSLFSQWLIGPLLICAEKETKRQEKNVNYFKRLNIFCGRNIPPRRLHELILPSSFLTFTVHTISDITTHSGFARESAIYYIFCWYSNEKVRPLKCQSKRFNT